jgi:hypothetical protein
MSLRFVFLLIMRLPAWLRLSRREETCQDRRDLDIAPSAHHPAAAAAPPPETELGGPGTPRALFSVIPKVRRHGLRLLVTPDTILRWHRNIVRRRWAARSRRGNTGRPRTRRNIWALVLRLTTRSSPTPPSAPYSATSGRLARTRSPNAGSEDADANLLDRALVWNQARLRRILREYEIHHNQHRPHRSLRGAPLKPLPEPADLG